MLIKNIDANFYFMLSLLQALVFEIYYVNILMPVADNHPLCSGDVGLHWPLPLMSLRCHGRLHGIRCTRDLIQNVAISIVIDIE